MAVNIVFATCERTYGLRYLQQWYPNGNVRDTEDSAKPLLDLVEKDYIRITDPREHPLPDGQMGVIPGHNHTSEIHDKCIATANAFIESCKQKET
jgi:hypothetical protein